MDLMTVSTSYQLLRKKYREFAAPTARIKVNSQEITEKMKTKISNLTVDLTSDYPSSGCSFDVIEEYLPDQTDFDAKGAYKLLQIGAKIEVLLGYISTEKVFHGFITEVAYTFNNQDTPFIHVECVDAKCLLMKTQRLEICREKKVSQAVSSLLSDQPVSGYLTGKSVLLASMDQEVMQVNMESDYDFIVKQARYTGCEFFIIAGKAYFRPIPTVTVPIMTLNTDQGILSACFSLRGAGLVEKVSVVGIDPTNDKRVSGSASAKGSYSKGATAKNMLRSTERTYFDPRALTAKEAGDRAKILMQGIENQFGKLECSCIGLPELVPGRTIKIQGLMREANTSFYITDVHHSYDENGFTTSFEARMNSL